jgi:hypothetical protein
MTASLVLPVLILMAIGGVVGWHYRHMRGASADLKVHKSRIPNFRRTRNRSGLIVVAMVLLALLVLRILVSRA